MATQRGSAPRSVGGPAAPDARVTEALRLDAEQTAWLLLLPGAGLTVLAMALLGPPLGELLFTRTSYTFWQPWAEEQLYPKPTEIARLGILILGLLAFAAALPPAAARAPRMRSSQARSLVLVVQALCLAGLVFFWNAQGGVREYGLSSTTYFTPRTIAVGLALAGTGAAMLAIPRAVVRLRALPIGRRWEIGCAGAALALTILWLLPSIFTDANIGFEPRVVPDHVQFTFDEAMSVLDGRSPLVDMATYGALVPYLIALPLAASHGSLAVFSILMVTLTTFALMAVYAVLRRLIDSPLAALVLFVPFLATSLFVVQGETVERFNYATYFGMFPIRYGGPYVLLWLTARHLGGERPRSVLPLFAVAGLVALNNTDFGLAALGATFAALLCARPPRGRRTLLALVARLAAGIAIALALVSLLTLLRAGSLPHLDRLFAYARMFGIAGFGNLPTPLFGFHLVILATYLAALATAVVRASRRDDDATMTGVLAWCGVFGIATGAYFVYRSHPYTLIAAFSTWSLTLAVLAALAVREALARGSLTPSLPLLALLFGFGIAACSIAQFPLPWQQVQRIAQSGQEQPLASGGTVDFVHEFARPGATVAILTPIGHRLAYDSDVTNVMAYTGMPQMPTTQQLDETIDALRSAGGKMLFLGSPFPAEVIEGLKSAGFHSIAIDDSSRLSAWQDGG